MIRRYAGVRNGWLSLSLQSSIFACVVRLDLVRSSLVLGNRPRILEDRGKVSGRQCLGTDPGVGRRAAPRGVNEPNRNLFALRDLPPKKVRNGGKVTSRIRRAFHPPVRSFGQGNRGGCLFLEKQPNPRMVSCRYLLFPVLERRRSRTRKTGKRKLHVRLPRGQPHIANQNILALDRRGAHVAAYRERVGSAGWFRLEPCFPIADGICFRCHGLAMEPDRHHFSRLPSPTHEPGDRVAPPRGQKRGSAVAPQQQP